MTAERYFHLMKTGEPPTIWEYVLGWHYCPDWDYLLVGPGMEIEQSVCLCFKKENV